MMIEKMPALVGSKAVSVTGKLAMVQLLESAEA